VTAAGFVGSDRPPGEKFILPAGKRCPQFLARKVLSLISIMLRAAIPFISSVSITAAVAASLFIDNNPARLPGLMKIWLAHLAAAASLSTFL